MKFCRALVLVLSGLAVGHAWAEGAGSVVFSSGSVMIENAQGVSRKADRGQEVHDKEVVVTGLDGRTQLRFRDGSTWSLQPESRFRIDEYRFSGDGSPQDRGFFSLLRGGFRTVSGLIGKKYREQYRVKTSVATIGIRGTAYHAALDDAGLRVTTSQGLVEVCNDAGCEQAAPGETVIASALSLRPQKKSGGATNPLPNMTVEPAPELGSRGGDAPAQAAPSAPAAQPEPVRSAPTPPPMQSPNSPYTPPSRGR